MSEATAQAETEQNLHLWLHKLHDVLPLTARTRYPTAAMAHAAPIPTSLGELECRCTHFGEEAIDNLPFFLSPRLNIGIYMTPSWHIRLMTLLVVGSILSSIFRIVVFSTSTIHDSPSISRDLHQRHEELRLLEDSHYPRSAILTAEGVSSPANSVYPPNAFPWLWLMSPFADFRMNQWWHGAWSLAALGIVLRYAWSVGATTSRLAALTCMSSVVSIKANFLTFEAGQYGLIQIALMLISTLFFYNRYSLRSGLLFGISLFKPNNVIFMLALYFRERYYEPLVFAAALVVASACAVSLWSGHNLFELAATTYPPGGMKFTKEGYSLVSLVAALGVSSQLASLVCAAAGFAVLLYALRPDYVRNDPLIVMAVIGCVTRISMYHRAYDDLLLTFLFLAILRQWIVAPSRVAMLVGFAMGVTLIAPSLLLVPPPAMMIVWVITTVFVLVKASPSKSPDALPEQGLKRHPN